LQRVSVTVPGKKSSADGHMGNNPTGAKSRRGSHDLDANGNSSGLVAGAVLGQAERAALIALERVGGRRRMRAVVHPWDWGCVRGIRCVQRAGKMVIVTMSGVVKGTEAMRMGRGMMSLRRSRGRLSVRRTTSLRNKNSDTKLEKGQNHHASAIKPLPSTVHLHPHTLPFRYTPMDMFARLSLEEVCVVHKACSSKAPSSTTIPSEGGSELGQTSRYL